MSQTDQEIADIVEKVLGKYTGEAPAAVPNPKTLPRACWQNKAVQDKPALDDDRISQAIARVFSESTPTPAVQKALAPAPDDDRIANAIVKVLGENAGSYSPHSRPVVDKNAFVGKSDGIFDSMDEAVEAAAVAYRQYLLCSMGDRERFISGIREVFTDTANLEQISRLSVEETGMGHYGHKVIKNRLAAEKTPGTEDLVTQAQSGDDGLSLLEMSSYGVIGSITPTTNPTETIICNSIGMLAAGNTVVYSPHPRATKVSHLTIRLINEKLASLGAPANLVVTVSKPSIENTQAMMSHPQVRMLVATGGPSIVKTVLSSGKKAIGAGAGNPPVVVDETADIEKAAVDIINGCSFDNNLPCIAEKEVIAVEQIADFLIYTMQRNGACLISDETVIRKLMELVLNEKGGPKTEFVGKDAAYILDRVGISVDESVRVILIETPADHPFVVAELMMPILPLVRVENVDDAIDLAIKVEHGNRHTAIMHSTNVLKLTKFAKLIQTTIFVKNGPSYAGIGVGGEGYTTFTIAGPTGEGLTSARSFARARRCCMVESLNIR